MVDPMVLNDTAQILMNTTAPQKTNVLTMIHNFFFNIPTSAMGGDFVAILLMMVGLFLGMLIIRAVAELLINVLKKLIILSAIAFASFFFVREFIKRVIAEGITVGTVIFGIIGVVVIIAGIYAALKAVFGIAKQDILRAIKSKATKIEKDREAYDAIKVSGQEEEKPAPTAQPTAQAAQKVVTAKLTPATAAAKAPAVIKPTPAGDIMSGGVDYGERMYFKLESWDDVKEILARFKELFNPKLLIKDRNFIQAMIYMVVAEFGTFSSKTIPAPTPTIGFIIFIMFVFGAFFFVKHQYKNSIFGLRNYILAFGMALIISIVLGVYWDNLAASLIFSTDFFSSDCLVGMISGMGVALFVGSKDES